MKIFKGKIVWGRKKWRLARHAKILAHSPSVGIMLKMTKILKAIYLRKIIFHVFQDLI